MPITEDGVFLQVWNGPGVAKLVQFIPYGNFLLLPANTIHAGWMCTSLSHYNLWLHFYILVSKKPNVLARNKKLFLKSWTHTLMKNLLRKKYCQNCTTICLSESKYKIGFAALWNYKFILSIFFLLLVKNFNFSQPTFCAENMVLSTPPSTSIHSPRYLLWCAHRSMNPSIRPNDHLGSHANYKSVGYPQLAEECWSCAVQAWTRIVCRFIILWGMLDAVPLALYAPTKGTQEPGLITSTEIEATMCHAACQVYQLPKKHSAELKDGSRTLSM
jgi:hypothetical protein